MLRGFKSLWVQLELFMLRRRVQKLMRYDDMGPLASVLVSLDPDLALASPHSENAAFPDSEQSSSMLKSPV